MMKLLQWWKRRRQKEASGQVAKERLRLVLAHDRSSISPALLGRLKDEIITVISQHVEIDTAGVQVSFTHTLAESRLVADIPLMTRGRVPKS
jgi:cell division topological specificity factor